MESKQFDARNLAMVTLEKGWRGKNSACSI